MRKTTKINLVVGSFVSAALFLLTLEIWTLFMQAVFGHHAARFAGIWLQ